MANSDHGHVVSDGTDSKPTITSDSNPIAQSGFGSLTTDDIRNLNRSSETSTDDFQIVDDTPATTQDTTSSDATKPAATSDTLPSESEPFDKSDRLDTSPPVGEFEEHELPNGGKAVTFNPNSPNEVGMGAPLLFDKDGKNIIPIGAGGGGNGHSSSSFWEYRDGSEIKYVHGDSHMTYTGPDGKEARLQLKQPINN